MRSKNNLRSGNLLTPCEIEVAHCLSLGLTNAKIAHTLYYSERTVKNHLSCIFKKLGVRNRTEAAVKIMFGKAYSNDRSNILKSGNNTTWAYDRKTS